MEAYGKVCSLCSHEIGKGVGKRTGVRFTNVLLKLNDLRIPQLRGITTKAEITFCLNCLDYYTNEAWKIHTGGTINARESDY